MNPTKLVFIFWHKYVYFKPLFHVDFTGEQEVLTPTSKTLVILHFAGLTVSLMKLKPNWPTKSPSSKRKAPLLQLR